MLHLFQSNFLNFLVSNPSFKQFQVKVSLFCSRFPSSARAPIIITSSSAAASCSMSSASGTNLNHHPTLRHQNFQESRASFDLEMLVCISATGLTPDRHLFLRLNLYVLFQFFTPKCTPGEMLRRCREGERETH